MAHARPVSGLDQVPGLVRVALGAASAVDDDLDPAEGRVDALPCRQVRRNELQAAGGRGSCTCSGAMAAAEDADVVPEPLQSLDDQPPERPCASRDENGPCMGFASVVASPSVTSLPLGGSMR